MIDNAHMKHFFFYPVQFTSSNNPGIILGATIGNPHPSNGF